MRLTCPYCDELTPEGCEPWLTLSVHLFDKHLEPCVYERSGFFTGSSKPQAYGRECPCGELFATNQRGILNVEKHLKEFGVDGYRHHIKQAIAMKLLGDL